MKILLRMQCHDNIIEEMMSLEYYRSCDVMTIFRIWYHDNIIIEDAVS